MPSLKETLAQAGSAVQPQVEGLEHVPTEGPAILAFNHVTPVDALLARLVEGRRVHFVPSGRTGGLRGWLPRRDRGPRSAGDLDDVPQTRRVLERGELLGVFPEGERSPDGNLHRAEPFVARLVLAHDVPVVPAAVVGAGGLVMPRLVFGPPVDLERFRRADLLPPEVREQAVADAVVAALLELSGQGYVDRSSSRHRAELGDERSMARARAREEAAARRASELARLEQRRADRAAEAEELARAAERARAAAREQATRAAAREQAARDEVRRVRTRPSGAAGRRLGDDAHHDPLG